MAEIQTSRVTIRAAVRDQLTAAGSPFELVTETVRGHELPVFRIRARSTRDLVAGAARFPADNEFLVLDPLRLTFGDFMDRVARVQQGLVENHGITKGDVVAIFGANSPEWVVAFFAATNLGAVVAAINGWWTEDEVGHAFAATSPSLLIADQRRLDRLSGGPAHNVSTVVFGTPEFDALWNAKPAPPEPAAPLAPLAEDDPALILFTSGTTGRSKGATVTQRGLCGFAQSMLLAAYERSLVDAQLTGVQPDPPTGQAVTLGNTPLFHVSGLFGHVLMHLATGGKLVYWEGRFDPEKVLAIIEKEGVGSFSPMGNMGVRLIDHPRFSDFDTSSVTRLGLGGAPTSPAMQARLRAAFPQAAEGLGGGYGSSESTAVCTSLGGTAWHEAPESVGPAHLDVALEIRTEDRTPVATGEQGHIWVRSAYTMLGYWGDDAATAETIDADGWLAMGDIGHLDEHGNLTINSRARDMILRGAENIYPIEIQNRIDAHPAVEESAVVGVEHADLGQVVKAVVVSAAGAELSTEDLHTWCARTLAPFKVPAHWEIRTEPLPRTATGKILKKDL